MYLDEPRPQIGYRGSAVSRAKDVALKVAMVVGGALALASAFVLSLVFLDRTGRRADRRRISMVEDARAAQAVARTDAQSAAAWRRSHRRRSH